MSTYNSRPDLHDELAKLRQRVQQLEAKPFPENDGYQTEHYWAALFQQDLKTFRHVVTSNNIPYARWGRYRMIRKEAIEAYLDTTIGVRYGGSRKRTPSLDA